MKHAIILILIVAGYLLFNKYYLEPMAELDADQSYISLEKEKVEESIIVSKKFEDNMSLEKATTWRINENIKIKDIGTDFCDGNHTLSL